MTQQQPDALDLLLMRALDGEASEEERRSLLEMADAEPRLAEARELRQRLREALLEQAGELPDVVAQVMMALELDDGWDPLADALREAVAVPSPDIADLVMSALAPEPDPLEAEVFEADPAALLSALHDGELDAKRRLAVATGLGHADHVALNHYAELGRLLRESIKQQAQVEQLEDVWAGVAPEIGLPDPEYVPGWEPIAAALREAVTETARQTPEEEVALTAAVMNALPRPEPKVEDTQDVAPEPVPIWRMLLGNPTLIVAAIAAMLIAIYGFDPNAIDRGTLDPGPTGPVAEATAPEAPADADLELLANNEAEVEALEYADEVFVQVVQLGDGAPVLLMVDEGDADGGATL
ncbi:MAG: hypothetical protein H6741_12415 [Alphaproteobacteria bacterium]|nr:hypothetical protein [Alphaproteobacteria bacterium]